MEDRRPKDREVGEVEERRPETGGQTRAIETGKPYWTGDVSYALTQQALQKGGVEDGNVPKLLEV